tara:strand:- start:11689 stop:12318 length:630 start_codon:yes stop_codon:yes gene_type:complete
LVIKKSEMIKKNFVYFFSFFVIIFSLTASNTFSTENDKLIALGDKNSKITIKVFSSLTCPHCANFHKKIFGKLKKEFIETNVVRFEHHGFPLDLAALNAEKVLRCSKNPRMTLNFLDEIYEKQDVWASGSDINNINSKLIKMAKNYGLNDDKINNCLNNEKLEDQILQGRIDGNKKYSIESTPTIFINEKKYDGSHDYKEFKKAIEKFL